MTEQAIQTYSLSVARRFSAPPDRVFRAWTEPEELLRWFGPEEYKTVAAEVDLQVGGNYRIVMQALAGGDPFAVTGTYRTVDPPRRLVYTWRWENTEIEEESLVTVEFREQGGETDLVITHEKFATADGRDQHEMGWESCFNKLERYL